MHTTLGTFTTCTIFTEIIKTTTLITNWKQKKTQNHTTVNASRTRKRKLRMWGEEQGDTPPGARGVYLSLRFCRWAAGRKATWREAVCRRVAERARETKRPCRAAPTCWPDCPRRCRPEPAPTRWYCRHTPCHLRSSTRRGAQLNSQLWHRY